MRARRMKLQQRRHTRRRWLDLCRARTELSRRSGWGAPPRPCCARRPPYYMHTYDRGIYTVWLPLARCALLLPRALVFSLLLFFFRSSRACFGGGSGERPYRLLRLLRIKGGNFDDGRAFWGERRAREMEGGEFTTVFGWSDSLQWVTIRG